MVQIGPLERVKITFEFIEVSIVYNLQFKIRVSTIQMFDHIDFFDFYMILHWFL